MLLFLSLPQLWSPAALSASCSPSSSSSSWSTAWGRRTRAATTWERGSPPAQPIKRPQPRSFTHKQHASPPPPPRTSGTRRGERQVKTAVHDYSTHKHTRKMSWIRKTSIKENFCIEYCNEDLFFPILIKTRLFSSYRQISVYLSVSCIQKGRKMKRKTASEKETSASVFCHGSCFSHWLLLTVAVCYL